MGVEPTTFCLGSKHSTTELRPRLEFDGKSGDLPLSTPWVLLSHLQSTNAVAGQSFSVKGPGPMVPGCIATASS